jgi:ribosomal protein S27AE
LFPISEDRQLTPPFQSFAWHNQGATRWTVLTELIDGDLQMIEANTKCPKCGDGMMKIVPEQRALAPDLPEDDELKARCDKCGYEDRVEVVATDE